MTSAPRHAARRETVVLNRLQVETILIDYLGWEHQDAAAFWRAARRETRDPGSLRKQLQKTFARLLNALPKDGAR